MARHRVRAVRTSQTGLRAGSFRGRTLLLAHNLRDWLRFAVDGRTHWMRKRDGREWPEAASPRRALLPWRRLQAAVPPLAGDQAARRSCAALGIDWVSQAARGLHPVPEPARLWSPGRDHHGRRLWLAPAACRAWLQMRAAAAADGIALVAISGFRATGWQERLLRAKLARGQPLERILAVNAAPGFSEHHGGCALDLACPADPALEERFEHTAAFAWLQARAPGHGFRLSFPRNNAFGFLYEPWHWCFHAR